jgi:hypothetical protein
MGLMAIVAGGCLFGPLGVTRAFAQGSDCLDRSACGEVSHEHGNR